MKVLAKKFLVFMAVWAILVPGLTLAGTGPGDGTGLMHDILGGTPVSYTGEIASYNGKGTGFTLALEGGGTVVIFGLAPDWYWDSLGYARPDVGDAVLVDAFQVEFDGVVRNIAMSITLIEEDVQILLRDPETGLPLWRAAQKQIRRLQNRAKNEWNNQQQ